MFDIMFSCKEFARIATKATASKLTSWESFSLGFHKLMCKGCRGFTAELDDLAKLAQEKQLEISRTLDDQRKERILNSVEQQISDYQAEQGKEPNA